MLRLRSNFFSVTPCPASWRSIGGGVLGLLLAALSASAATYTVSTPAEFSAIPSTLNAGDVVILQNGTYSSLDRTITSSIADDTTAQSNPVVIRAATPGGVVVTGPSRLQLRGRGITVAGIDFGPGSMGSAGWIISLEPNSRYLRLNNLRFLNCSPEGVSDYWIQMQGYRNTIEYCSFVAKRSSNVVIAVRRTTSSEPDINIPREHVIRYCYFGPRECSVTDNGYETIRIGDSSSQAYLYATTVENCVFYRSVWRSDGQKPNDPEVISNKGRGNIIRYNTLLESTGQITLRHGDACVVEGNYIFGNGYYSEDGSRILMRTANALQAGIRIIGQDHIVRNNYLINLRGTGARAALCLMGGALTWNDGDGGITVSGDSGYETADRAQVYNNTFIDCGEMNLGYTDTTYTTWLQPSGVKIFNNAWQSTVSGNGIVRNSAFTPESSAGNYIYSTTTLGWTGIGGTRTSTVSSQITQAVGDILIPASTSPLLNAANSTLAADLDMRGLARPATGRDIGAYEREVSGSGSRPLLRAEVGPEFDGGPIGRYPFTGGVDTPVAPSITQQPTAQTGAIGSSVTFTVGATGSPRPNFQWLKDGVEITDNPSAFTSSFVLSGLSASDIAHYTVRVTNAAGRTTSVPAPLSLSNPVSPVTLINEQFTDGERATQSPPNSLAWFCSGASTNLTVASGAMTLSTSGTSGRHAVGYFTLPVSALAVGERLTLGFDFSVAGTIRDQSAGLRFGLFNSQGGSLFSADSVNTSVSYTGYAAMANLAPSASSPADLRRRNAVSNALLTSVSSYTTLGAGGVQASFAAGTVYRGNLQIERTSDTLVSLSASFTGGTLPTYAWTATDTSSIVTRFDTIGFALSSSSSLAAADTITLDNISLVYSPNTVSVLPEITSQPLGRALAVGSSVSFTIAATGTSTLSYQWRKNGVAINGATQPTLTLSNLQLADSGWYSVVVTGSSGSRLSSAAQLSVQTSIEPYQAFLNDNNLTLASDGAPAADLDSDGLSNLLEFVLGGNPRVADAGVMPTATLTSTGNGDAWVITFQVAASLGSVTWGLEQCADLKTWSAVTDGVGGATVTLGAITSGRRAVTISVPATGAPTFFRLRATLP